MIYNYKKWSRGAIGRKMISSTSSTSLVSLRTAKVLWCAWFSFGFSLVFFHPSVDGFKKWLYNITNEKIYDGKYRSNRSCRTRWDDQVSTNGSPSSLLERFFMIKTLVHKNRKKWSTAPWWWPLKQKPWHPSLCKLEKADKKTKRWTIALKHHKKI